MITPDWVRMMAANAAWQNAAYAELTADLSETDWWADRGAFFGSLGATSNHILWADSVWLTRLAGRPAPPGAPGGIDIAATRTDWARMRSEADSALKAWAGGLSEADLAGNLEWTSSLGDVFTESRGLVVTHVFTHAIHHRGQVHAMLTAMGRRTLVTDLLALPKDMR